MKSSSIRAMLEKEVVDSNHRSLSMRHLAPMSLKNSAASKKNQMRQLATLRANVAGLGPEFCSNATESRVLGHLLAKPHS